MAPTELVYPALLLVCLQLIQLIQLIQLLTLEDGIYALAVDSLKIYQGFSKLKFNVLVFWSVQDMILHDHDYKKSQKWLSDVNVCLGEYLTTHGMDMYSSHPLVMKCLVPDLKSERIKHFWIEIPSVRQILDNALPIARRLLIRNANIDGMSP